MQINKKIFFILTIILAFSLGLFARFHSLDYIYKNKDKYFYTDDRPVLFTADGYVYLRYARDFKNGEFKSNGIDKYKNAPENFLNVDEKYKAKYPPILPLSSSIYLLGHLLTDINLDLLSSYLAPILALLVIFPLTLYFYRQNLYLTALSASIVTVISYIYVIRTYFARPDTDVLNLFFPFMIVYLSYRFLTEKNTKKLYLISVLLGLTSFFYYWWYLHPHLNFIFLLILIFLIFLNKLNFKLYLKPLILVFIFSAAPLYISDSIYRLIGQIKTYIIGKSTIYTNLGIEFPHFFISISELQKYTLSYMSFLTVGNEFILVIGLIGVVLFFIKYWRTSLLFLPILLIGLLTFKSGNRFAIYLAPFIGIGFGYTLDFLVSKLREENRKKIFLILFFLVPLILVYLNLYSLKHIPEPLIPAKTAKDFYILREKLPKNSWIWTWWDNGFPIEYIMKKTTYVDGSFHNMPKFYFVAKSFSSDNLQESYNVVKALSYLGTYELAKKWIKEKIPLEKIVENINIKNKRNIYVMFTKDMIGKFYWITYFGNWDFEEKKGKGLDLITLGKCKSIDINIFECGKTIIDIKKGIIKNTLTNKSKPLAKFVFKSDKDLIEKDFNNKEKYVFEIISRNGKTLFLLTNKEGYKTTFNQMYLLNNYDPKLFKLIYDNFPYSVVFKLKH